MAAINVIPCPPPATVRTTDQRRSRLRRHLAAAVVSTAILYAVPTVSPADDDWEPTNYQKRFEESKNGLRLKDNNVWVYKRSFSERFGMPERWIDDDLEGAEAVAYRVEWSSLQQCGYFGEPDNCRPIERCLLDVYLTDRQSEGLPWKTSDLRDFIPYDSSTRFLTAQNRMDAFSWDPDEKRWDISRANIGLDSIGWVSGPTRDGKVYSASSSAVSVLAYDREIFRGLDYIKLATDCNIARRKQDVRIFFTEKFPKPIDYGFRYVGDSLKASPEDEIRFERAQKEWYAMKFKGDVPHILDLPDSYMARINEYDRTVYRPKSLATEVERKVSD